MPLDTRVRVSWVLADGLTPTVVCQAVDISETGLRVTSKEPVPLRQYVSFRVESLKLNGTASVRSCTRSGMRYVLGLEFSGGTKWTPPPSLQGVGDGDDPHEEADQEEDEE